MDTHLYCNKSPLYEASLLLEVNGFKENEFSKVKTYYNVNQSAIPLIFFEEKNLANGVKGHMHNQAGVIVLNLQLLRKYPVPNMATLK